MLKLKFKKDEKHGFIFKSQEFKINNDGCECIVRWRYDNMTEFSNYDKGYDPITGERANFSDVLLEIKTYSKNGIIIGGIKTHVTWMDLEVLDNFSSKKRMLFNINCTMEELNIIND